MKPHLRLTCLFAVTAVLAGITDARLRRAGDWLPAVPETIGLWTGANEDLSEAELAILGYPKHVARVYSNPVGDQVTTSVLAANSMNVYHDPRSCSLGSGYTETAEKLLPIGDRGALARAMVFSQGGHRAIMFYWLQNSDGTVDREASMRRDVVTRLGSVRTIFNTVLSGRQTCVIRVYAPVGDNDEWGARARKNVAYIASEIYRALLPKP